MTISTVDDVFAAFGGPTKLGEALGITRTHAGTMKTRGSIPPEYWERLVAEAQQHDVKGITYEALAKMAAGKRSATVEAAE